MRQAIGRHALVVAMALGLTMALGLSACVTASDPEPTTLSGYQNQAFGPVSQTAAESVAKKGKPQTAAQKAAGSYLFDDGAQLGSLSVEADGDRLAVTIEVTTLTFEMPYVCRVEFGGLLKKGTLRYVDAPTGEAIEVTFDGQQATVSRDGPTTSRLCGAGAFFAGGYTKFSRQPDADASAAFVQRELARLGYYAGTVDGQVGPKTEEALARFKQDLGLPDDKSVFSPQLVEVLLYR